MTRPSGTHLVIVEAYDGLVEFVAHDSEERASAQALGLPVEELAERLRCRITVLGWDEWLRYESLPGSFLQWMPSPVTRPIASPGAIANGRWRPGDRIRRASIPAVDPAHGLPFATAGLSPQTYGLLADSDPLFLASVCLEGALAQLHQRDPLDAVIVPMWGGCGYVAQLARATGVGALGDVPFGVVVTDTSANRQRVNGEGLWTRAAVTRRQMEDLSLALADLVLVFGPRGEALATAGRLPDTAPPVHAPRFVPSEQLDRIASAADTPAASGPVRLFLDEPQQPAAGVLVALDAVAGLRTRGSPPAAAVVSAGPDVTFAPMKPASFARYWSSRGFVRELVAAGLWRWDPTFERRAGAADVRLYPSLFEHLPDIWSELARGTAVLLSPAASEGLAPGQELPADVLMGAEPTPEVVAERLTGLTAGGPACIDAARRQLCRRILAAHRGPARERLVEATAKALGALLDRAHRAQDLARVGLLLLDRRLSLSAIAAQQTPPPPVTPRHNERPGALTVVVVCFELGALVQETVESVWASSRPPDELLLVDDGSEGDATRLAIQALERTAEARNLPLRVIRQPNRGLAAARNAGLAAANAEFISFLDGDDLIEPGFYDAALTLLTRHPDLGGVAAWALCFGDHVPDGFWNAPQPEFPPLFVENTVIVPCMMRTAVLRELGGYDAEQRYNYEDWELSVRMLASGRPIVTIPRYLQRYRMRPDSMYRTMSDVQNQGMRERLLQRHRETVSRFGVEVAMQIEHRLMRYLHRPPGAGVDGRSGPPLARLARTARRAVATAAAYAGTILGAARDRAPP